MEINYNEKRLKQVKFQRMNIVALVLQIILFFIFDIFKDGYYLHKYVVVFGLWSMYLGLNIGLNSDRINNWITKMKTKFSKKIKELPEINQ
jgi:hypothetical protein